MKTILKWCFVWLLLMLFSSAPGWSSSEGDFRERCAPCHGSKGAGDTKLGQHLNVRDMGSADVQKQSDDELSAIIRKGKGKMPAYDGKLSKDQIEVLVKYIRTLKK